MVAGVVLVSFVGVTVLTVRKALAFIPFRAPSFNWRCWLWVLFLWKRQHIADNSLLSCFVAVAFALLSCFVCDFFFDVFTFVLGCSRRSLTICTFFSAQLQNCLILSGSSLSWAPTVASRGRASSRQLFLGWETWNRCNSDHRGRQVPVSVGRVVQELPCTFSPHTFRDRDGTGRRWPHHTDKSEKLSSLAPLRINYRHLQITSHFLSRPVLITSYMKLRLHFFSTHWDLFVWFFILPQGIPLF